MRNKRLGFLPDWRIFSYLIIAVNILFLVLIIVAISGSSGHATNCGTLDQQTCDDAKNVGTTLGVGLVVGFWAAVDVILGIIWLVTRSSKRQCPGCGHSVKKGVVQCATCGHYFRGGQTAGGYAPGWYPDNTGVIRWFDGRAWTEHTQQQTSP
jgi:hypothetical protein